MGIVLSFKAAGRLKLADQHPQSGGCEIVIFPGVRIERRQQAQALAPDADPTPPGRGNFDDANGGGRPRKTS
jgi:hypothetical protein